MSSKHFVTIANTLRHNYGIEDAVISNLKTSVHLYKTIVIHIYYNSFIVCFLTLGMLVCLYTGM